MEQVKDCRVVTGSLSVERGGRPASGKIGRNAVVDLRDLIDEMYDAVVANHVRSAPN
ncbi:hypothetical protein ACWIGW_16900 [Nocardia brasiliensis]